MALAQVSAGAQDTIALIGATVIYGTGAPPRANTTVVIGGELAAI